MKFTFATASMVAALAISSHSPATAQQADSSHNSKPTLVEFDVPDAATVSTAVCACSNDMLRGEYAFTITGQILAPPPAAGPVAGVALTHFDGHGNMTQIDHVVHNGVTPVEDWRPGSGPYEVNPDCTGSFTITPAPTDPADGSPELKLYFVVEDNGHTVRTVVSGSPVVPAFTAAISSVGTRVRELAPE